jgi:hypothetical protein
MPNGHETRGILGYLNPRKGSFTPLIRSASEVESEAAILYAGTNCAFAKS